MREKLQGMGNISAMKEFLFHVLFHSFPQECAGSKCFGNGPFTLYSSSLYTFNLSIQRSVIRMDQVTSASRTESFISQATQDFWMRLSFLKCLRHWEWKGDEQALYSASPAPRPQPRPSAAGTKLSWKNLSFHLLKH